MKKQKIITKPEFIYLSLNSNKTFSGGMLKL